MLLINAIVRQVTTTKQPDGKSLLSLMEISNAKEPIVYYINTELNRSACGVCTFERETTISIYLAAYLPEHQRQK